MLVGKLEILDFFIVYSFVRTSITSFKFPFVNVKRKHVLLTSTELKSITLHYNVNRTRLSVQMCLTVLDEFHGHHEVIGYTQTVGRSNACRSMETRHDIQL